MPNADLKDVIHPGEGVLAGPPAWTRREFALAAAGAAASALASAAGASEQADQEQDPSAEDGVPEEPTPEGQPSTPAPGEVGEDGAINALGYNDATETITYRPYASFTLPLGCQLFADCDSRAAVLQSHAGGNPLATIGCLDYSAGTYTTVLSQALAGQGYSPTECHITDYLVAWVEMDDATDDWVLFACPFFGGPITRESGVVELWRADSQWLPANMAVWGDTVVWQVMPDPAGKHVLEQSHAYQWRLGADAGTLVWSSPGRFACAPSINVGVLTIAPRVRADEGVYYGITAIDLRSGEQLDQLVLPVAVRPFMATYISGRFAFSIEANYGYGGLLGQMGYYIGTSRGPFLKLVREPSAQVCWVGGKFVMRSQMSYFVIDEGALQFSRITAVADCLDYGDYPATTGTSSSFVTYAATKDPNTGIPSQVITRIFIL